MNRRKLELDLFEKIVTKQNNSNLWSLRWGRTVTLVICLNLLLVFFNLTYIPLRQIYLHYIPALVEVYDPVKAIEPQPVTEKYLSEIAAARSHIAQSGLTSETAQTSLARLRQQSATLIAENPFLASGRITVFARLKRRMGQFTGAESAEQAFQQFWQVDYLKSVGWPQANHFLQVKIVPLLQQNYFRETLPTGQFVDEFWRIDLIFILFLGGELLIRTFILSRIRQDVSWGAALARRWYELPLVLPFWRWLRFLPAAVRLHRTQLLDVEHLIGQVTYEPAAYLSDRVSKFALVRLINQTQTSIQQPGWLNGWSQNGRDEANSSLDKFDQITDRLLQLVALRVMPSLKPDLEQLLRHSLRQALVGSEFYSSLQQIPGVDAIPGEALDNLSKYLAQASCDVLANSYTDPASRVLLDQLNRDFRLTLGQELRSTTNSKELRHLLAELLEELKIAYIQRSEQDDPKTTLQEVDVLDKKVSLDAEEEK
jgi:hypothetical protein